MKQSEFKQLIRETVQEELYKILPVLLKESMQSLLKEQTTPKRSKLVSPKSKISASPKSFGRERLMELLGYENEAFTPGGVPTPIMEHKDIDGEPVATSELPDHLVKAFNRNYSSLLKVVDKKINDSRP